MITEKDAWRITDACREVLDIDYIGSVVELLHNLIKEQEDSEENRAAPDDKAVSDEVTFIPIDVDSRNQTDRFKCSGCGCSIQFPYYQSLDDIIDYSYCPYCGKRVKDNQQYTKW